MAEMEWEFNKYPLFAWAGEGDRITALGRWIFDCGHPNTDPEGACSQSLRSPPVFFIASHISRIASTTASSTPNPISTLR